jgi:hypothetical protein
MPIAYTLPLRSQNTRRDRILPELKAILNDNLFWVDPYLRLSNNVEIAAKYNAAGKKIFEDGERKMKSLSGNGDNDQEHVGQDIKAMEGA